MPAKATYRAPSVKRALTILELVAESDQGLGISELARRLGVSKGSVFGICGQLEAGRALVRDGANKRYRLGPLISTLAGRGSAYTLLRQAAGPELTRLRDELSESVFLGVLSRGEISVVDARQPTGRMGIAAGPGTRLPITAGAAGKAIMSGLEPDRLEQVLAMGLPAHTPASIVDLDELTQELARIREQGFCLERNEYLKGMWGVAAFLGAASGLPAALWVAGFTGSLQPDGMQRIGPLLRDAANRIKSSLGA